MIQPTAPTPLGDRPDVDSLNVNILLADDRGETRVLPADPEILAHFLAECRQLKRGSSANDDESKP